MLAARLATSAARRPANFGRLPIQSFLATNTQFMMLSTSAVRKDIDSAAKYIGAGLFYPEHFYVNFIQALPLLAWLEQVQALETCSALWYNSNGFS